MPEPDGISRREFLSWMGAGAAATAIANPAWAVAADPQDFAEWKKSLFDPAAPRRYFSDVHTDARMHLGGIGTGNFEIGADGQLTTWQLFNTLRDGHVPFYFLAKVGKEARLLQTRGGPALPRVKRIEMSGEYPTATLSFQEPAWPVALELSAFTPFAPLDADASSMPAALLVFKAKNPTAEPQTVSIAALMQNPVGYDATDENTGTTHPAFGGNRNEVLQEPGATGLFLTAEAGSQPSLDKPITLLTTANLRALNSAPPDRPENLHLEIVGPQFPAKSAELATTAIWLEEAALETPGDFLRSVADAVRAGATLIFSGRTMPLLSAYASWTGGKPLAQASSRPDVLFEDFEHGYGNWQVEGEAFGKAPASGTLPNQNPVTGFLGSGLVNSYFGGDDTTGRLTSKSFTIQRKFIRFLIGGGRRTTTQMRLLVGGKVVRAASGKDNELLEPALWDVSALEGQTAQLLIVDEQKGGWGHINVDQIEFSDQPGSRALIELVDELLPVRFSGLTPPSEGGKLEFAALSLKTGATRGQSNGGMDFFSGAVGKGKVVVVAGPLLEPKNAGFSAPRQQAYGFICGLLGAHYVPAAGQHPKAPGFGSLALAALGTPATVLPAFEKWEEAASLFSANGAFERPEAAAGALLSKAPFPTPAGHTKNGGVAASITLAPGQTAELPFALVWHYPNKYNAHGVWMGCQYATRWPDARAVMRQVAAEFSDLRQKTERFHTAFYQSTLPWWLLDCASANAGILRHIGIIFRIANGDVYGWEGSNGCCDPTCTHVWGYEQTFSRLFPELERDMRRIDFKHQQGPDGGVNNRTQVPSPPHPSGEHPFVDGHASCILKAYREALNSPDESFFKEYWPHVNKAVEYLIGRDAASAGGQPIGVLQDDQWNTYDEALHGVSTFISGYYLAALRAGEEWARRIGDTAAAERFQAIFQKGRQQLVDWCWNGEYFQQRLDDYQTRGGEFGPGCMADQLIGQWWAHQLGLGYILPREQVVSALRSIYKYNFKPDLTGWKHAPRAFAGARDKGLIVCTWPKGGRPKDVMLYSDEVWTGIEYQVAAHMIYEGLMEEGLAIVKGARERYDGVPRSPIPRNPWNEIECGGHYARAMSSWSLLLALSGFRYDAPRGELRMAPQFKSENFKCFVAGPEGWGSYEQVAAKTSATATLALSSGTLRVKKFELNLPSDTRPTAMKATKSGQGIPAAFSAGPEGALVVDFSESALVLKAGESLTLQFS